MVIPEDGLAGKIGRVDGPPFGHRTKCVEEMVGLVLEGFEVSGDRVERLVED